jgi:DNA-binding LacI/PurR family transcriptional regulator
MDKKTGNIKMEDLARLSGKSVATVSRTFRKPEMVKQQTRDRIMSFAKKHNYIYDATAGDLSRNHSTVFGVLVPTTNRSLFGNSILGIQEKTAERGYSVIIGNTKYDKNVEENLLKMFQQRRVAGLIITGFSMGNEDLVNSLVNSGIACVVIWEKLSISNISYVGFDNSAAAYSMMEYLIYLNHRRVGLIVGPFSKMQRTKKRHDGYLAALDNHGIAYDSSLVVECNLDFIEGKYAAIKLMSLAKPPTAIFAASDTLAIGALAGIKECGLNVPQDVSLAGFDDIDFAAYCDPPLTTIRIPAYEMGQLAVAIILKKLEKKEIGVRQYCLDTELIIRKSCMELKK